MKLCTSISPAWRALGLSDFELFSHLKDCGFSRICGEINAPMTDAEIEALLAALKTSGVKLIKERTKVMGREKLLSILESCRKLGVSKLVIPLLTDEHWKREDYMAANAAYLKSLIPAARENGVTLLIEHAGDYQNLHYTHGGMELNSLLDRVNEDGVLFNLNVGNLGMTDLDLYPEVRLLRDRLGSVDMNDNFFGMALGFDKEREDLGFAPLMGFLDYDEVMRGLTEIGYDGEVNLLLNYPRAVKKESLHISERRFDVFPLPLLKQFTVWTANVTRFMLASYNATIEEAEA